MKNYQKIPSFVTLLKYIHSDRNFNVSRTNFEVMEIMENYKSLIISHRYSSIYHPIRWLEIALTFLYRRLKISFSNPSLQGIISFRSRFFPTPQINLPRLATRFPESQRSSWKHYILHHDGRRTEPWSQDKEVELWAV